MAKDLIFIFVFVFLILFPLGFCFAGEKPEARRAVTNLFRVDDFQLTTLQQARTGEYCLQFAQHGKVVFECECAFKVHEPKIVPDVPRAGCRSLLAYCFSGGAHCCTTLFITTECNHRTSLTAVDLAHGAGEVKFINVDGNANKAIKVTDWQFAYYGPEDSSFELSFADSPAISRLLVFDDGNWRVDKTGEFSSFYSGLMRESMHVARTTAARCGAPEAVAAKAIKAAYYSIMTGGSTEEPLNLLNQLLPANWKPESEKILKDIRQAISEFNPVEAIQSVHSER